MSKTKFEYVPLTFINDQEEIKKQIRNTLILIHLFEKYNSPVRLEKLIEGTQYGYNASALQSGINKFLRISDIHESKVNWETVPFCNCDDEETYLLKNEDILIARTGGTTGKSFKIDFAPEHAIYAGYLIRIRAKETVNPDYIYLFLHSFAYWSQIVNLNERNFRPKANAENLKSLVIPNCDKNIQDEAVLLAKGEQVKGYEELNAKIEKVLAEYEKSQKIQLLLTDQLTQIENLNQAILQEAVQGKLVPQDPNDEPASELLKRIKNEKEKSGKKDPPARRAGKPLPPIKPDEIPFEIPESWVWCRLGEICDVIGGFAFDSTRYSKVATSNQVIRLGNVKPNQLVLETSPVYIDEIYASEVEKSILIENDILITMTGTKAKRDYLFSLCLKKGDFKNKTLFLNQRVGCFRFDSSILPDFINYTLKDLRLLSPVFDSSTGAANQANIGMTALKEIIIPLPPFSEQDRIVIEIMNQIEKTKQLKEHIISNQQATEQLLKALLHEAFVVEETKVESEITDSKIIEFKPTNVDYYKRTVLAAEIVWQLHKEPTLGHLKLQKLIYLCQQTAEMQLPTNFLRHAMGPYDPKLMRSIDKQLKLKKWFEFRQGELLKYKPLEKAGEHRNDYIKYFSAESESIQFLIDTFKTIKSDIVEIVATLYACLNKMQHEKLVFSEPLLIQRFYEWSEEKKKFSEKEISRVFSRMKETGIIPKGCNF